MVKITAAKMPDSQNLVLGATELNQLCDRKFDGIIAIHLIQSLNRPLMKDFFQQVHDLLLDQGKFLLVFTNNCFPKSGYQLEGSMEDLYLAWYKHNLDDVIPPLSRAHLKPIQLWMQQTFPDACGIKCPFALICQKLS